MELRTFISRTLKDIVGGIQDAQNEIEEGEIIPPLNEKHFSNLASGLTSYQTVDFEVSVATIEKEGSEKLSVVSAVIGGHVKGDSSNSSDHVAKLGFKVPVKFPRVNNE